MATRRRAFGVDVTNHVSQIEIQPDHIIKENLIGENKSFKNGQVKQGLSKQVENKLQNKPKPKNMQRQKYVVKKDSKVKTTENNMVKQQNKVQTIAQVQSENENFEIPVAYRTKSTRRALQSQNSIANTDISLEQAVEKVKLRKQEEDKDTLFDLKDPQSPLPDIDSITQEDPLQAAEYAQEIYQYYQQYEINFQIQSNYMDLQVDINHKMRAILNDWLVDVHQKFKLMPETLYLTINLIDRYLEKEQVTKQELQLVGCTAMLVAAKYEEIWAPEVRDYVYISDRAYTRDQILQMEKSMLNALKYQLTIPTTYTFAARYLKACGLEKDKKANNMVFFLLELSLVDYEILRYKSSIISCSSLVVSQKLLGHPEVFPKALQKHSGFEFDDIQGCMKLLVHLHAQSNCRGLQAVYKKYCNAKYCEVAKIPAMVEEDICL